VDGVFFILVRDLRARCRHPDGGFRLGWDLRTLEERLQARKSFIQCPIPILTLSGPLLSWGKPALLVVILRHSH